MSRPPRLSGGIFHRQAIRALSDLRVVSAVDGEDFGAIQVAGGFLAAVKRALRAACDCRPTEDDEDDRQPERYGHRPWCAWLEQIDFIDAECRVIPDAWVLVPYVREDGTVDRGHRVFVCFEVEERHPIGARKLRRYTELFWLLDDTDHLSVEVLCVDRHGVWVDFEIGRRAYDLILDDLSREGRR
jgi:hypothetical protein